MNECVILFRNPDNGRVGFVGDGDEITVFSNMDAAVAGVEIVPILRVYNYQIVELDEL